VEIDLSDSHERRREQSRNTADHATWRSIGENRGAERARDAVARAMVRSDSEERRRENSRNTADHATWRSIKENRGLERLRDAAAHRITRNNPITRTQKQRTNTVHHRNTRLQQRFREQQIQEMADERLLTYRSSSKNRQAESSRQLFVTKVTRIDLAWLRTRVKRTQPPT